MGINERFHYGFTDIRCVNGSSTGDEKIRFEELFLRGYCLSMHGLLPITIDSAYREKMDSEYMASTPVPACDGSSAV